STPCAPKFIVRHLTPEAFPRKRHDFLYKPWPKTKRASRTPPAIADRLGAWVETLHGVEVFLMCTVPPPQFGNPSCSPSNAFLASRETATDKTKMDEAKSFVAKTYLK